MFVLALLAIGVYAQVFYSAYTDGEWVNAGALGAFTIVVIIAAKAYFSPRGGDKAADAKKDSLGSSL